MNILGIDVGGSGIKGALVDIEKGVLATERHRIPTPESGLPDEIAEVVGQIAQHFKWQGPIGITFPAIVRNGVTHSAANVHDDWIGAEAQKIFESATGCPVIVLNDADAAGVAEISFGAGRDKKGVVMMLTLGTGIGSALFIDGILVPNTELGHLEVDGAEAEHQAADSARKREDLGWKRWAKRLDKVLQTYEALFSPELFILGGGVSKKSEKYIHRLTVNAPVVPAELLNEAGIVGAAMAAKDLTPG
ncbi:MAG: ROK family protein [Chloroflexota bacterium]